MNVFTKNPNLNKKNFFGGRGTGLEYVKIYFFSFRVGGGGVGGGGTRISKVFFTKNPNLNKKNFFFFFFFGGGGGGGGGGLEYVIFFYKESKSKK